MPTCKELLEQKEPLAKKLRQLADLSNDANHKWSTEDEANWNKVNEDYNALNGQIERLRRVEAIEQSLNEPANDPPSGNLPGRDNRSGNGGTDGAIDLDEETPVDDYPEPEEGPRNALVTRNHRDFNIALQSWCRYRRFGIKKQHLDVCRRIGVNPSRDYLDIPILRMSEVREFKRRAILEKWGWAFRAQSTSAGAGGETIPEGFVNAFERSLLYFGGMREVATILRTATGNALPWPTTNDTGNVGALLAENTAASEQDIVTAAITFNAFKYTSKLIKVSVELLQDSAFDLAQVLGEMLGERIGRITNTHYTTGTGSGQPNGIVTASSQGAVLPTGNTLGFTTAGSLDSIFDLVHSVDRAYRQAGPNTGFLTHDATLAKIRKVRDTTNQYIWQPSLSVGEGDRLLGYPVTVNNDVAVFAANAKVLIFGALGKYIIRDVASFRLRRLVERFADADQEGFVAFSRHDGDLLDSGTDPVKHLAASAT